MDNLTHTLVGAALAESGLKRAAPFGAAVLLIGANLPDLDVLAYLLGSGTDALAFRRGWTHGVLAMGILPLLLAGAVLILSGPARRRPMALIGIAAVAVWSHPLLDLLNVYGIRLLMPFSERWFYGDALFIVDPWVWLALAAGVMLAWRRQARPRLPLSRAARPARFALAGVAGYAIAMAVAGPIGRRVVQAQTGAAHRTMVAPVFGNPFWREVIRDQGGRYETGALQFGVPTSYSVRAVISAGWEEPGAGEAARSPDGVRFLRWARFPRFEAGSSGGAEVRISDLRFSRRGGGWASVTIEVPG